MEALAVIPARGGSQRIPRKNTRRIAGKPLIQWTVEAALASDLTRVVVSTEDVEIATIAKRAGAEIVPQPLDSALRGDYSAPVVMAALRYLEDTEDYRPDVVALLHPTSPFRSADDINAGLTLLAERGGAVVSVSRDVLNGALYLTTAERFERAGTFLQSPLHPLRLTGRSGIDIDTWDDLELARQSA